MKSFQAKLDWKRIGKRENKKLSFRFVPTRCVIENSKKITKKFKKLKKTIMNSVQAKIGWKRMRKLEVKIFVPFRSYSTRNTKFQKNSQKIQNIKKYQYCNIFGENRLEKDVNEIK